MKVYCQRCLQDDDDDLKTDDRKIGQSAVFDETLDNSFFRTIVRKIVSTFLPAVVVLVVEGRQQHVRHRQEAPDQIHLAATKTSLTGKNMK